jgi:hypothetical protein
VSTSSVILALAGAQDPNKWILGRTWPDHTVASGDW